MTTAARTEAGTRRPTLRQLAGQGLRWTLRQRADVGLLLGSGLFDPEWYAATAGCRPEPAEAAEHFLREGCAQGHTPHPLFDQRHFLRRAPDLVGDRNPLVAYLQDERLGRVTTHPLMGFRAYMRRYPQSRRYARGTTRHYLEVGAPQGYAPNVWYVPDLHNEPQGLADWLRARRHEWTERQKLTSSPWVRSPPVTGPGPHLTDTQALVGGRVSVLVDAGRGSTLLAATVAAVLGQRCTDLEVVVLHEPRRRPQVLEALGALAGDRRLRLHEVGVVGRSAALHEGVGLAEGDWIAFAAPPVTWLPDHLAQVVGEAVRAGAPAARDVLERVDDDGPSFLVGPATRERSLVGPQTSLNTLVVRRESLEQLGGLDAGVRCALGHELELGLLGLGRLPLVPALGARTLELDERTVEDELPLRERPNLDLENLGSWHQVVLARHLVDWDAARARSGGAENDLVSVIIPTYADSSMTVRAVRSVLAARAAALAQWEVSPTAPGGAPRRVEVLVVDNGCDPADAAVLEAAATELEGVRVIHQPVNRGFSLGNSVAVPECRGGVVVFLNNDTQVSTGWLEPLLDALEDPQVHGAQSLLVYPSGSIQSAGISFPASGGVPHMLLQGFPVEDAAGIEEESFSALTAAALAMRYSDVVALEGFDALFLNGMEDVDLGLRMSASRPGRFVVRPDSVVVHHESKTPGRFARSVDNRKLLLDRWGDDLPGDDVRLWGNRGFELVGREIRQDVDQDRRASALSPVLRRRPRPVVKEGPPSLRWALKNPAPAGPEGERWGDTHFVRSLAAALRRLGQEVVVDHRDEFDRASGRFDDVALAIRGNAAFRPTFGQVNLAWVISHPEMLSRREAQRYDRVFAASTTWSERMSREWGLRIDPLLQATDPALFTPAGHRPDTGHALLFVGGSRKVLRPMVGAALEARLPLSIIGNHWEGLVEERYVKQEYLVNSALGEAYRRAGIVLNDHWEDMRVEGFLSNRLFDAVASGARVVTDDVAGLEGLFGRSVQVARDAGELAALVTAPDLDQVFGDDNERKAVAAEVRATHAFDNRAASLLEAAVELRRRGGGVEPVVVQRPEAEPERVAAPTPRRPSPALLPSEVLTGLVQDGTEARVVLVLNSFATGAVFAGIETAVRVAAGLALRQGRQLTVVVLEPVPDAESASESLSALLRQVGAAALVDDLRLSTTDDPNRQGFHPDDLWVATFWTTAYQLGRLCHVGALHPGRVVYLVQDWEPAFYPWGTEHALAEGTYGLGFHLLVNSSALAAHLEDRTGSPVPELSVFAPQTDATALAAAARAWRPGEPLRPRVLFYARPSKPRNMYALGIATLERWAAALDPGLSPIVTLAGERLVAPDLGPRVEVRAPGKLTLEEYYELLSSIDVGLSLMCSPHPSHPALDLPMAGIPTVTNALGGRRRRWVPGLELADETPEALADGLRLAVRSSLELLRHEPHDLDPGLGHPLDQCLDGLLRRLADSDQGASR